ncbi:hypothetical protein TNCV_637851 [Trichonephila clavipes]|nr:hypothetical protein TNCV_637851 [Trichonephila clavipes]
MARSLSDPHFKTWERSKEPSQLSTDSTHKLTLSDTRAYGQCPSRLSARKEPIHSSVSEWLPVRLGGTLSAPFTQAEGVPQASLYVDDLQISCESLDMSMIEQQ